MLKSKHKGVKSGEYAKLGSEQDHEETKKQLD